MMDIETDGKQGEVVEGLYSDRPTTREMVKKPDVLPLWGQRPDADDIFKEAEDIGIFDS